MVVMVTIAAAGDLHASPATRDRVAEAFEGLEERVDVVLLAGDLTTHGDPEQAEVVADACRGLEVPVCAVLGNHDLHLGFGAEIAAALTDAGARVLVHVATCAELCDGEAGAVDT